MRNLHTGGTAKKKIYKFVLITRIIQILFHEQAVCEKDGK